MNVSEILNGPSVPLEQMLSEREWRAAEQRRLLGRGETLVVLSTNVAGPVKRFPLLMRGFDEGRRVLEERLSRAGLKAVSWGVHDHPEGPTAFYGVSGPAEAVKRLTCQVEALPHLGRLLDLDVLGPDGRKWERSQVGLQPRRCLVCGGSAADCGRSRRHSVEQLQEAVVRRLTDYFCGQYARKVENAALRAMLYEVAVTPKPGLVDRSGTGAHRDMDFFTFLDSAAAVAPYLGELCLLGCRGPGEEADLPGRLRALGQEAESAMFRATGGVNTHKGLIFSLGLLAAAAGQQFALGLAAQPVPPAAQELCRRAGDLAVAFLPDLGNPPCTHGGEIYRRYGAGGIRREAADGFPSVLRWALPCLREEGSWEQRGRRALVALMAHVEDTNVLFRGGPQALEDLARRAGEVAFLPAEEAETALWTWDWELSRQGISPGGCADLLAVGYFLRFLESA